MANQMEFSDYFRVNVSNSKNDSICFDIKLSKSISIAQLKGKLEVVTGGNASTMRLVLYNGESVVGYLDDDTALLGCLPIGSGMRLHVIDSFSWIDDNIDKFELTDEQYNCKTGTVRNFLKTNRFGKYNDEDICKKEERRLYQTQLNQERAELCTVGSRCQVTIAGNPTRRGTIMYNGPIDGKNGIFIGVKFDEPLGKNNGSIGGKSYFECSPKYGGFVSPMAVELGNFPENLDIEDEI